MVRFVNCKDNKNGHCMIMSFEGTDIGGKFVFFV